MKKLLLIILMGTCCCLTKAQPQPGSFSITPKVGMTLSTLTGSDPSLTLFSYQTNQNLHFSEIGMYEADLKCRTKYVTNVSFGLEAQRQYTRRIGLTLGCYYTQQGAEFEPEQSPEFSCKEYKTDLKYILVPVLGKFYMYKGFALEAGLQPGFLISDKTRFGCTFRGESFKHEIKIIPYTFEGEEGLYYTGVWGFEGSNQLDFDLSAVVGLSCEIRNLVIGARYHLSTISVFKEYPLLSEDTHKLRNSSFLFSVGYRFDVSK